MKSPAQLYLQKVLGVHTWLSPVGDEAPAKMVAVFTDGKPSQQALDLIRKMFMAIGVKDYDLLNTQKDLQSFRGAYVFELQNEDLMHMLDNSQPDLQKQTKMRLWSDLQKFKLRINQ